MSHDQLPRLARRWASCRWILASASAAVRSLDAAVEVALGAAQVLLGAPAHRHVGAERQARHRQADHEGEQQQEGFVDADLAERSGMLDRRPDRKAGEDHADGGGVARAAPQRRPDQRQDRQEAERARIFRARQQRAEGDKADGDGAAEHRDDARAARGGRRRANRCCAHSTITGVTTSAPAVSPSHQVIQIGPKFAQAQSRPGTASPRRWWR